MANVYTSTTTYDSVVKTIWQEEIIAKAMGYLIMDKWAITKGVPVGAGDTYKVNRILRPAKITAASTEGNVIAHDNSVIMSLTANKKDITMERFNGTFGFSRETDVLSFVSNATNQETIANHLARSMEYQVMQNLHNEGMWHRVDKDGTYQLVSNPDSTTSTEIDDDSLSQAENAWNNGNVCIIAPNAPGYDLAAIVTDFNATDNTLAIIFDETPSTDSYFRLVAKTGLIATDKMTIASLIEVQALHEILQTQKFEGGILRGAIHPLQKADIITDTTVYQNLLKYDMSEKLGMYEIVRLFGTELMIASEIYRTDADGVENQLNGAVFAAPIFGANAYCILNYGGGEGSYGVEWIIKDTADSGDIQNAKRYVSWETMIGLGVLRATSVINLLTGATDLDIDGIV